MCPDGEPPCTGATSPLDGAVRRCGGQMIERNGHSVAGNFGSAASEAAVCLRTVGMTDRSDRVTLDVCGERQQVDQALTALTGLNPRTWRSRLAQDRAIVRCEAGDREQALAALSESGGASVAEISPDYAAIGLIGPRARDLLAASGIVEDGEGPIVIREADATFELLIAAAEGPALWDRVLAAGTPLQLACVGVEALEHLAASPRLSGSTVN